MLYSSIWTRGSGTIADSTNGKTVTRLTDYVDGLEDGFDIFYLPESGYQYIVRQYKQGIRNGIQEIYYTSGTIRQSSTFLNGALHGNLYDVNIDGEMVNFM